MTGAWGGAQWVLATLLVVMTIAPPVLRKGLALNGVTLKMTWTQYWGEHLGRVATYVVLTLILWWGGFWS